MSGSGGSSVVQSSFSRTVPVPVMDLEQRFWRSQLFVPIYGFVSVPAPSCCCSGSQLVANATAVCSPARSSMGNTNCSMWLAACAQDTLCSAIALCNPSEAFRVGLHTFSNRHASPLLEFDLQCSLDSGWQTILRSREVGSAEGRAEIVVVAACAAELQLQGTRED